MKKGNWIPMDKALSSHLPKTRPYGRIEAAFSLQLDYDGDKPATVAGYSSLWGWSRNKVAAFLESLGVVLEYPQDTRKRQNQKGQIKIQIMDRKWADNGQIRLIDSKWLDDDRDRSGTDNGQKMGRSKDTTRDPNPNPDPNLKKIFPENSVEFSLSSYLLEKILERDPDYKPAKGIQDWCAHTDRLIRLDNRDPETIRAVIDWCQKDHFWQANILSTSGLRKKFPTLFQQMNNSNMPASSTGRIQAEKGKYDGLGININ